MTAKRFNPFPSRFGIARERVIKLKMLRPSETDTFVEDVIWRDYDMLHARHMVYVEKPTSTYAQTAVWTLLFSLIIVGSMYIGFQSNKIHWPALMAAMNGQAYPASQSTLQPARPSTTVKPASISQTAANQVIQTQTPQILIPPMPVEYGPASEMNAASLFIQPAALSKEASAQVADEEPISVELVANAARSVPRNNMQDETVTLGAFVNSDSAYWKKR